MEVLNYLEFRNKTFQNKRSTLKVMPVLLHWPKMSEENIGGIEVDWKTYQFPTCSRKIENYKRLGNKWTLDSSNSIDRTPETKL